MSSGSKFLKASLRLVVFLGVLRFLILEANDHHETGVLINKGVAGNMKQYFAEAVNMGRRKHRVLSKFDLNYMIKRRVPNGPDPIHNRRAGNSHRPPGHA